MSSTETVAFGSSSGVGTGAKALAFALPLILTIGFAIRIGFALFQPHVVFFDETIQYFEQAHRLAFGSGIVPWEFVDGIRSWLLPGLIALVMTFSTWFGDNPMVYVGLTRTLCAALSMVVVVVGFRMGARRQGNMGAIVTGGFCALWFDLVYFAPAVMNEMLAAHFAIAALFLGEDRSTRRRTFWIGILYGAAVCFRYQYAPPLALAAAWQFRRDRDLWPWLFIGAVTALLPFTGVLDAITWGRAFQSIWLNFIRNSLQGVASAIGVEGPGYYLSYLSIALLPLPLFLGLAAIGARRFPALAIAAGATLVMHSLVPHKEVRFIYLTIAAMPILIGLGASELLHWLAARHGGERGTTIAWAGAGGFLALSAAVSIMIATGPLAGRWSFQRGTVHAFLAAHDAPDLCGLQIRDMPSWKSGGYTYLNRDVPLVFEPYEPVIRLPGVPFPLRFMMEREGNLVPRYRSRWSHVIAEAAHAPPGFPTVACFPDDARPGEPELCLFRRPEGCL